MRITFFRFSETLTHGGHVMYASVKIVFLWKYEHVWGLLLAWSWTFSCNPHLGNILTLCLVAIELLGLIGVLLHSIEKSNFYKQEWAVNEGYMFTPGFPHISIICNPMPIHGPWNVGFLRYRRWNIADTIFVYSLGIWAFLRVTQLLEKYCFGDPHICSFNYTSQKQMIPS